jgi:16S rRNA (guanine(966)-N(2))-methyltransferase RsmD
MVFAMRIIAGTARGMHLTAPKGLDVRPTLDRVREAYFNILGPSIEGAAFLDLFAGTGANGIEALSRGAARAVFVEQNPMTLECIQKNLEATRLEANAQCHKLLLPEGLAKVSGMFDLVFADPPYAFSGHEALLSGLQEHALLSENALICIEHAVRTSLPETVDNLSRTRQKRYGDTVLSFYA